MRHCQRRPLCSRRWSEFRACRARQTLYCESTRFGCSLYWESVNDVGCVAPARESLADGLGSDPVALAGSLEKKHVKWKVGQKKSHLVYYCVITGRVRHFYLFYYFLTPLGFESAVKKMSRKFLRWNLFSNDDHQTTFCIKSMAIKSW